MTRDAVQVWAPVVAVVTCLCTAPVLAQQQKVGAPPEAKNMRLIGYDDILNRSAYQLVVHKQGNRYVAYIGHHGSTPDNPKPVNKFNGQPEFNGTSIVDVTDPAHPVAYVSDLKTCVPEKMRCADPAIAAFLISWVRVNRPPLLSADAEESLDQCSEQSAGPPRLHGRASFSQSNTIMVRRVGGPLWGDTLVIDTIGLLG